MQKQWNQDILIGEGPKRDKKQSNQSKEDDQSDEYDEELDQLSEDLNDYGDDDLDDSDNDEIDNKSEQNVQLAQNKVDNETVRIIEDDEEQIDQQEQLKNEDLKDAEELNQKGEGDFKRMYITPPDKRITRNILSKTEFVSLTGQRAMQIEQTGNHFANISKQHYENGTFNALEIAQIELLQKQCPLLLKRQISNQYIEIFDVNTMILPKIKFPAHILLIANKNQFQFNVQEQNKVNDM